MNELRTMYSKIECHIPTNSYLSPQSADDGGGGGGGGDDRSLTFLDSEVEYQLQRHRKDDSIVTLNVGGTRYEVRRGTSRERMKPSSNHRERESRKPSINHNIVLIGCRDTFVMVLYHLSSSVHPVSCKPCFMHRRSGVQSKASSCA